MQIHKKIWPKYFDAVKKGKKKFELRINDFKVKNGDILILEEWNPKTKKYTGRKIKRRVTYVFKFKPDSLPFYSKKMVTKKGLQIIGLK